MHIYVDGGKGIENYGSNNKLEDLYIVGAGYGIHSDAVNTYVYDVRIDSCDIGIRGHGSSNSLVIEKALISNSSDEGCYFYNNTSVHLDRVTVNNFGSIGIDNNGTSASYVHCKRCLVYKNGSYGSWGYCYLGVTFDNAWDGATNDNVAMGDDCKTDGHDFYACSGTQRTSYDDYPAIYSSGSFKKDEANIAVNHSFLYSYWYFGSMSDHVAKMLCYYVHVGDSMIYNDNVGYDTDITKGLGKWLINPSAVPTPQDILSINAYPNPFNRNINIESEPDAKVEIYNLAGCKVYELSSDHNVWHPDDNVSCGLYLVKACSGNRTAYKKIQYIK